MAVAILLGRVRASGGMEVSGSGWWSASGILALVDSLANSPISAFQEIVNNDFAVRNPVAH